VRVAYVVAVVVPVATVVVPVAAVPLSAAAVAFATSVLAEADSRRAVLDILGECFAFPSWIRSLCFRMDETDQQWLLDEVCRAQFYSSSHGILWQRREQE
jgi:hypothetical protein